MRIHFWLVGFILSGRGHGRVSFFGVVLFRCEDETMYSFCLSKYISSTFKKIGKGFIENEWKAVLNSLL